MTGSGSGRVGQPGSWRDDPDHVEPVVLVLGGFLTSPPLYIAFARRLRRRGAAEVVVARVWTPDWILAASRGLGPLVTRAGRSLLAACDDSLRSDRSRGAPVLVVGHSAGGLLGRLLTSPLPFAGRTLGAAPRIGALVTLGTPHHVSRHSDIGGQVGRAATRFADRVVPGAAFTPRVSYVSVASGSIPGDEEGDPRARTALRFYRGLLGPELEAAVGDGIVPVQSALLDGATRIVLQDVVHGQFGGGPWYGSEEGVDLWWPQALGAWHAALRARVESLPAPDAWRPRASGGSALPDTIALAASRSAAAASAGTHI